MKMTSLRFLDGPESGRVFQLKGTVSVGRYRDNDIVLKTEHVSRHHARIVVNGEQVVVQDLGSKNGTFVNGQKVSMLVLMPGDSVSFGNVNAELFETDEPTERIITEKVVGVHTKDWIPDKGFAGFTELTEISRHPTGTLFTGTANQYGKADVFAYLPRLSFATAFKQYAQDFARKRSNIAITGLPKIIDVGLHNGVLYVVTSCGVGRSLTEMVSAGRFLTVPESTSILAKAVGIFSELHSLGMSHGAITPENLLYSPKTGINLSLFGIITSEAEADRRDFNPMLADVRGLCAAVVFGLFGKLPLDRHTFHHQIEDSGVMPKPDEVFPEALYYVLLKGLSKEGRLVYSAPAEFRTDIYDIERGDYDRVMSRMSLNS